MKRRRVLLRVEYDGSSFHGWQYQPDVRTVEGEVRAAIAQTLGPAETRAASRTDRGVHARGQAVAFSLESPVPTDRLPLVLNARLPADVRVHEATEVPETFDPRREALGKLYRFTFVTAEARSVFLDKYAAPVARWPEVRAMVEAAQQLVGEHDFRCFQGATTQVPLSTVRRIIRLDVVDRYPYLHLYVLGNAFLYRMVRNIAGTLIEVGGGKRAAHAMPPLLQSRDRRRAGPTAEARGLCLVRVCFSDHELELASRVAQGSYLFLSD